MAVYKVQTGLRIEESLYEKLKALATKESRSINNLAEHVLKQFVADYEQKHGPIELPEEE